MDKEQDLLNKINAYKEAAKDDKNIDVAALMLNALETSNQNRLSSKQKNKAYLVSFLFPPFGLIYALKFYFGEEDDAKQAALICVIITVFAIVLFFVFIQVMFSQSGLTVDQLKQTPNEYRQLLQ